MKLILKKEQVKGSKKENADTISCNFDRIKMLSELQQDWDYLNSDYILRLVYSVYDVEFSNQDYEAIAKSILKRDDIKKGCIKTSFMKQNKRYGIGPKRNKWYDVWRLDAYIFYKSSCNLDFRHTYTKKELIDLLINHDIVIIGFQANELLSDITELTTREIIEPQEPRVLSNIPGSDDLGIFEEPVLRELKRHLQPKRIAKDICRLICLTRSYLENQQEEALRMKDFHEEKVNYYDVAPEFIKHSLELLTEQENESLKRIRS